MIHPPSTIIKTLEELKEYLQIALKLEHATIPPYLTAAYSAKIEENKPSIDIIRAVAKEEMLHLTLVANLLNAIGGHPNLLADDFVPNYPTALSNGQQGVIVSIEKFSPQAITTFLGIERPDSGHEDQPEEAVLLKKAEPLQAQHAAEALCKNAEPLVPLKMQSEKMYEMEYNVAFIAKHKLSKRRQEMTCNCILPTVKTTDSEGKEIELHYWSIGDFYKAISLGFKELNHTLGHEKLFTGERCRQIPAKYYYSAGGDLTEVTDLRSALAALELIAGQGEGTQGQVYDHGHEIAHYFRFDQIMRGRYYRVPKPDGSGGDKPYEPQGGLFPVNWDAVFPAKRNAKVADYQYAPELLDNALEFNGRYKRFLQRLHEAFNGKPDQLSSAFASEMFGIKHDMERLLRNPIPGTGENAAPTFEMGHCKLPSSNPEKPAHHA